jgi:hypothetical protein
VHPNFYARAHEDLDIERKGSALWFCKKKQLENARVVQTFAQPHVNEEYDISLSTDSTSSEKKRSRKVFDDTESQAWSPFRLNLKSFG